MNILVQELDANNIQHVNQFDGAFLVDSRLDLKVENGIISYTVAPVANFYKRYSQENIDYTTYIVHPDKSIFFAYIDGQPVGQVIVRKNWNNYAYVQDIAVDVGFRKNGIGRILMARAVEWARSKHLAGFMVETQNNNVSACRFYERLSFQLGGFDRLLYKGAKPDTDEIALYWYLVF